MLNITVELKCQRTQLYTQSHTHLTQQTEFHSIVEHFISILLDRSSAHRVETQTTQIYDIFDSNFYWLLLPFSCNRLFVQHQNIEKAKNKKNKRFHTTSYDLRCGCIDVRVYAIAVHVIVIVLVNYNSI